jgi:hypothetical protein
MNQVSKRVCIYPKDIQRITGKSYRQSTRILNEIRKSLRKPKNSLVSIVEFCEHTGLKIEEVRGALLD